ncbi:hypothetical protein Lal_00025261 [Lupinus albus]|nr:hypothetical protein Lal_00025261 [Lupinus albus]
MTFNSRDKRTNLEKNGSSHHNREPHHMSKTKAFGGTPFHDSRHNTNQTCIKWLIQRSSLLIFPTPLFLKLRYSLLHFPTTPQSMRQAPFTFLRPTPPYPSP